MYYCRIHRLIVFVCLAFAFPVGHAGGGHGKLLSEIDLGDKSWSTDTKTKGVIDYIDMNTKAVLGTLNISNSTALFPYPCTATHGIGYQTADKAIYVECSNPSTCVAPDYTGANCPGALWWIDSTASFTNPLSATKNLPQRIRLTSPYLAAQTGFADYGLQGAPYDSPDNKYIFVPNKNKGVLAMLKPRAGTTPLILEVALNNKGGTVVFYPKDITKTYGTDTNSGVTI